MKIAYRGPVIESRQQQEDRRREGLANDERRDELLAATQRSCCNKGRLHFSSKRYAVCVYVELESVLMIRSSNKQGVIMICDALACCLFVLFLMYV